MGRLEEILDNHIEGGAGAWKKLYDDIEIYTKECVIASLEKASYPSDEYGNPKSLLYENGDFHVPQSLITSQENIILL